MNGTLALASANHFCKFAENVPELVPASIPMFHMKQVSTSVNAAAQAQQRSGRTMAKQRLTGTSRGSGGIGENTKRPSPAREARRAQKAAVHQVHRDWLLEVLRITGLKPSHLAAKAGVSDTTLSRLANDDDYDGTLLQTTITAISSKTGVAPPDAPGFASPAEAGIREDAVPWTPAAGVAEASAIQALTESQSNRLAFTVRTSALLLAGVLPGDVVVFDTDRKPASGDVVLAEIDQGIGAVTVCRLWQPPHLIAASLDPTAYKPEYVDNDRVRILGTKIALLRF